MNFVIEKDEFLKSLKIVEKATLQRAVQPILANILIETREDNSIKFCASDLDIVIISTAIAQVKKEGKITLPAKKLLEIASKIPDKPVEFVMEEETQTVKITCGSAQFEVVGITADEYPENIEKLENLEGFNKIQTDAIPFITAVKKTSFAAANTEARNVISGIFCSISETEMEMAATDGNRLARIISQVNVKFDEPVSAIIPAKFLLEVQRVVGLAEAETIEIYILRSKIVFKVNNVYLSSYIIEGTYPPYKQLIPKSFDKTLTAKREEVINALERVAIMVNEKMNIVKLKFNDNKMYLEANTVSEGTSEDVLDVVYEYDEMSIAFNYRFIIDCLKVMETENIVMGLNGSLSATVFKPENEENYMCLIMPIQVK